MEEMITKNISRYFETDDAQLICGNSFEILKRMRKECVDMIFADPPYFVREEKWFR